MIPVVIVPTLNQYEPLQRMLDSIDYPVDHLIVIDNGGVCPDLRSPARRTSIVRLPANIGVASAWNLGIKIAPHASYWLIASDDIEFIPGRLSEIPDLVPGGLVSDWSNTAPFTCFAVSEEVIDEVGLFDDYFWPGVGEDRNYQRRIRKAGLPMRCLLRFYNDPTPGATRKSLPNSDDWLFDNNSEVTSEHRGFSLRRRRYIEETYLKGGPPIHATNE